MGLGGGGGQVGGFKMSEYAGGGVNVRGGRVSGGSDGGGGLAGGFKDCGTVLEFSMIKVVVVGVWGHVLLLLSLLLLLLLRPVLVVRACLLIFSIHKGI